MSATQEATSSGSSEGARAEKSIDKLSVKEFRKRFCIPNGVLLEFLDGEAVSTEKVESNAINFAKEQFNVGLWFPLPSLFKEFLHFTQIPPAYIHPNTVRVLMGCSVLNLLYNLDLSLLEILFVYSLKKGKNDIFSMAANLPSLQLGHPERPFSPNHSLKLPSPDKRGRVVEWVEKASFLRLNKLFEVSAAERQYETLLTTRNLSAVVRESQEYVVNILSRKLPKKVVPGEHYVLKDLPFLQGGGNNKGAGESSSALYLEWSRTCREFKPLGALLVCGCRLAILAEEAASINTPDSPHPDEDAGEAVRADASLPMATPMEEMGAESQGASCEPSPLALVPMKGSASRWSHSAHNLNSGLIGRLQDRFQETIEVSCSSVLDDHSEESETEMATETPAVPVVVPDEGVP
ncbi:hypothetical protein CK203_063615 [Vitis vinifera]|uniref:Uncharacterized protein n=1 Tax=Vitis vinifera TaxID=29760 RepID=A0A438G364_VITVI|nr:hypothetical protein CK203_115874 [Vitis vinifera]RVW66643.1 hypothetical protein CK203_063615 [Vitis vinifera]